MYRFKVIIITKLFRCDTWLHGSINKTWIWQVRESTPVDFGIIQLQVKISSHLKVPSSHRCVLKLLVNGLSLW